jgi:hypothetical protein
MRWSINNVLIQIRNEETSIILDLPGVLRKRVNNTKILIIQRIFFPIYRINLNDEEFSLSRHSSRHLSEETLNYFLF